MGLISLTNLLRTESSQAEALLGSESNVTPLPYLVVHSIAFSETSTVFSEIYLKGSKYIWIAGPLCAVKESLPLASLNSGSIHRAVRPLKNRFMCACSCWLTESTTPHNITIFRCPGSCFKMMSASTCKHCCQPQIEISCWASTLHFFYKLLW